MIKLAYYWTCPYFVYQQFILYNFIKKALLFDCFRLKMPKLVIQPFVLHIFIISLHEIAAL